MKLPVIVEQKIEEKLEHINLSELKQISSKLSNRYMNEERNGQSLLSKDIEALSYLVIRMPATYCAVKTILDKINLKEEVKTFIDVGAGTGAASIGILEQFNIQEGMCIEREKSMQDLGKELLEQIQDKEKIDWVNLDIEKNDINKNADLVITSYMINEIKEKNRLDIVKKLLNLTNKYLIIIEPGTPEGFKNIRKIHEYAIENKIKILAPCIGNFKCTLPTEDWCHSIVRVERNKVHRYLKQGDAPYEDEKFSYIVLYKESKENKEKIKTKREVRILRHPIIEKGKITLKICFNGIIEEKIITKNNKELFKIAKKAKCGDAILI